MHRDSWNNMAVKQIIAFVSIPFNVIVEQQKQMHSIQFNSFSTGKV